MTDTPVYDALLADRLRQARQALEQALELEEAVQARERDLARREQLLEQSVAARVAVAEGLAGDRVRQAEARVLAAQSDAADRLEASERRADLRVREARAQAAVASLPLTVAPNPVLPAPVPPAPVPSAPTPPAPSAPNHLRPVPEPPLTATERAREPRHFLSGFALPAAASTGDPETSADDVADGVRRPARAVPGMDALLQSSPRVGRYLDALFGGPDPR